MKNLAFVFFVITLFGCSSVKKTQEAINYGNYDEAIEIASKNLRSNKTKKSNQPYVLLLEEAFQKVTKRDLEKIKFLKKDGNPANLERIYTLYNNINNRQNFIKPLLPLPILKKGKNADFNFEDYSDAIITSKENLSQYLYSKAKKSLATSVNKEDFRIAFNDLNYLNDINPSYSNTEDLIKEAHYKGTDFVFVYMQNKTNMVIPMRLQEDLLNFDTYKLNNLWTVYHTNKDPKQQYDFELELNLREINISPEQVKEKVIVQEKLVKDGWKYLIDEDGNAVKDSLGNTIKVDKFKKVKSRVKKFTQFKSVQVVGQVHFFDLETNQQVDRFPISSEFIFEHFYATYSGNKEAIDKKHRGLLRYKYIPFPTNEQMIYDTGEDLKKKIKSILSNNKLR